MRSVRIATRLAAAALAMSLLVPAATAHEGPAVQGPEGAAEAHRMPSAEVDQRTLAAEAAGRNATRVAGTDRWGTSAAVAEYWQARDNGSLYVVSGRNFPHALSAAARSGAFGQATVPVLLTDADNVPTQTRETEELRSYTTKGTVRRIAGADRYETAVKMTASYRPGVFTVILASGVDYPDALSGASLAAAQSRPLLLTAPDVLPAATKRELERLKPKRIVVLGGSKAVDTATAQAAGAYTETGSVTRVAGADRYETAEQVSLKYFSSANRAVVASGDAYPDALVASVLGTRVGAPPLLTKADEIPAATDRALRRLSLVRLFAVGGRKVISIPVLLQLSHYLE